ncbi:hypothetical protein [Dielma fastidiosa]|uniref:hypothetical protein n=1 Tax=Dielma fastidiosa TaxID=1034346 RepID=UPI0023F159F9|nr:hypothetical protein [Dielma fastidiosa]
MASNRILLKERTDNMYIYAQLDADGYCIAISQLSGKVNQSNLVELSSFDTAYMKRKYDVTIGEWTDEYMPEQPMVDSVQEAIDAYTLSLVESDLLK